MLVKITHRGLNTIIGLEKITETVYKVEETGMLIDLSKADSYVIDPPIEDFNKLSAVDIKIGEVLLFELRCNAGS